METTTVTDPQSGDRKREMSAEKNPVGLAARLYILCIKTNENISQRIIADAARITELTLRNRLRDIKSQLHMKRTLRNSTCYILHFNSQY